MKRLPAICAALLLSAIPAIAAEGLEPSPPIAGQVSDAAPGVELTLIADWQIGDSYRIEKTRERREMRKGVERPPRSLHSISEIRVAEKTGSGYVLVSTLLETDLSTYTKPDQGGTDTAAALSKMFEGQSLELITNEAGFPVALRNAEEVVELMRAAIDRVMESSSGDPEQRQKVKQIIDRMMTPQAIEAMAMKDAMVFYGLLGGSYRGGEAAQTRTSMIFPLTQTLLDGDLHVLLRRIDRDKGLAYIATQSLPDAEQLKQATMLWMTRILEARGQSVPEDLQVPPVTVQDSLEYAYDLELNMPRGLTFKRYFAMGDAHRRVDLETFRLLD
jgi:hypothetical protein